MTDVEQLDVCIVEDDPDQRALLSREIQRHGYTVAAVGNVADGLALVRARCPKVCFIDYELPDGTGLDLVPQLRQDPDLAMSFLVLITAHGSYELNEQAIACGADDYLSKPLKSPDVVGRLRAGVRMWDFQQRLRGAAVTDGLTGLYNHDHINRLLVHELNRSRRYGHSMAMMMIDLDYFKVVNDTYGHLVGNDVLEETSRIIRENIRAVDIAGRFGGEEFAIILPEATAADAARLAERIRRAMTTDLQVPGLRGHMVTASFGVADTDDPRVITASALVDLADRAMYLSKRNGRNRVSMAAELEDSVALTEILESDEVESLRRRVAALSIQTKEVYIQSVSSLLQALDEKDPYTARHSRNVAFYAERIASRMGCSVGVVKAIHNAALLHDIGKVGIPDRILLKPHALSSLELNLMAQVPLISIRIVDHLRILETETQIIRHQREHFDGSGGPNGLSGEQIPIGSRVLHVADAFDAMTTDRVYRQRREVEEVLDEFRRLSGSQFDPRAVNALRQLLGTERRAWELRIRETVEAMRLPSSS
jgi:diguanylate cyclase (GGDEF)-like protein